MEYMMNFDMNIGEPYLPVAQEEQYLIEEDFTYVQGWDESVQGIADRILKEYLQGKGEETLTEDDVNNLDDLVFTALETMSQ